MQVVRELSPFNKDLVGRFGLGAQGKSLPITGKEALFIWQFVRHNSRYRSLFDGLSRKKFETDDEAANAFAGLGFQFGLFPYAEDYRTVRLASGFHFFRTFVKLVEQPPRKRTWRTNVREVASATVPEEFRQLQFVVSPYAPVDVITSQ